MYKNLVQKVSSLLVDKNIKYLLIGVLIFGGFLRFYNLNWDGGYYNHPDEINIAMAVTRIDIPNQMDPEFYAYNGFGIYLIRAIVQSIAYFSHDVTWVGDWSKITLVGRVISAIVSTATIYLFYVFVAKLLSKKYGLLAAFLASVTVGFIQYAHYSVTESMLVMFLMIELILSLCIVRDNRLFYWYWLGIVSGLAVATKTSALSFMLVPAITWCIVVAKQRNWKLIGNGLYFAVIAVVTFLIFSPYTVLSRDKFLDSMHYEGGVVDGSIRVPYTLQFWHTKPYTFFLEILPWHMGVILPYLGFLGCAVILYKVIKDRKHFEYLPFVLFGLGYFAYVGRWYGKFIRYMLPLEPVLIIASLFLVYFALQRFANRKKVIYGITAVVAAISTIWAAIYFSVFYSPNTRIVASTWIFDNVPAESTVLTEHWDYGLPVAFRDRTMPHYTFIPMKNYDDDVDVKFVEQAENLEKGDYLILSSRRLSGTIPGVPEKYPMTSQYYRKLDDGTFGYTEVKRFSSYPHLGPFVINDDTAEESFQVYDHPVIRIYKNEKKYSREQILEAIKKIK